jgi:hypothetical protein
MALRQANSVSSTWTSVMGLTSSSMILLPTREMSKSGVTRESVNITTALDIVRLIKFGLGVRTFI